MPNQVLERGYLNLTRNFGDSMLKNMFCSCPTNDIFSKLARDTS